MTRLSPSELVALDPLLARGQLPVGRSDLPARQPALARTASSGAHQAPFARSLRHDAGAESHVRAPQSGDSRAEARCDLRHRSGLRRLANVAQAYLEGTYSERYADIGQDIEGMRKLFRQFSFPGGIPSHAAPETPGLIHEGGELGYALSHAFGAAFDNPALLVACVVGDGEAETGPMAASWHSNKFLNPDTRRGGSSDPASQRLQDREPNGARPYPGGRASRSLPRVRLGADARHRGLRRRGVGPGPRAIRGRARRRARRDRRHSEPRRARTSRPRAGGRCSFSVRQRAGRDLARWRRARRGDVARPPGSPRRRAREPRASRAARDLDEKRSPRSSSSTTTADSRPTSRLWLPRATRE